MVFVERFIDVIVPFGPFLRKVENSGLFKYWGDLLLHVIPPTLFIYWLFSFIPVVGTLIYILVFVPLAAKRHIELININEPTKRHATYLWYLTVVSIGFGSLWSFIGHTFMADTIATQIGWATGSPFQTELAFYTLGSGVAGIMAIWLRGHMITALVMTKAIFWYGAGFVHFKDALINQNYSPLNIGAPLIGDVILPTIFLVLLYVVLKSEMSSSKT